MDAMTVVSSWHKISSKVFGEARYEFWDDLDGVRKVKRWCGYPVALKETVCLGGFAKRSDGRFVGLYEYDGV